MFEACMQLIWEEFVKWMDMTRPVDSKYIIALSTSVQSLLDYNIDQVQSIYKWSGNSLPSLHSDF